MRFAATSRHPYRSSAVRGRSRQAPTSRGQLGLFADDIVLRLERAAPLVGVVAAASRSEPELAELLDRLHAIRRKNLGVLVDALLANGPLRLPRERALDAVWALTSPELQQLLTRVGGWSRRRHRDWLRESLERLLLVG